MRILYCGKLDVGSTSLSRFQAINELGNHVLPIDVSNYIPKNRILRGLQSKQLFSFNIIKLNRDLYAKALLGEPDIIWIDKGTMIKPEILKKIKKKINVKIVHYNTDDIFNHKHNFSNYFKSINYYDFHFTSNIHNVKELKSITNKDIF